MLRELVLGTALLGATSVAQPVVNYDVTNDGTVTLLDALAVLNHFGERADACWQVTDADPGDLLTIEGWTTTIYDPEFEISVVGMPQPEGWPAIGVEENGSFFATFIAGESGEYAVKLNGQLRCLATVL